MYLYHYGKTCIYCSLSCGGRERILMYKSIKLIWNGKEKQLRILIGIRKMCMVIRQKNMFFGEDRRTEEHVLWLRDKTCSSVLMSFKKNMFFCSYVFQKNLFFCSHVFQKKHVLLFSCLSKKHVLLFSCLSKNRK